MSKRPPNFYLTSSDSSGEWAHVRACWLDGRLAGPFHDQYARVLVEPAVRGGAGGTDSCSTLVLAPHAEGTTIFPVSRWPLDVYAYTPISLEVVRGDHFAASDVTLAAWAEIWPTQYEAREAALKPHPTRD